MNPGRPGPERPWTLPHVSPEPAGRGARRRPFRCAGPALPRPRWSSRKPGVPGGRRAALRGLLLPAPPAPTGPRTPEQSRPRARRGQERGAERARRPAGVAREASSPARAWAAALLTGHGSAEKHHGYCRLSAVSGPRRREGRGQAARPGAGLHRPMLRLPPRPAPGPFDWAQRWSFQRASNTCQAHAVSVTSS